MSLQWEETEKQLLTAFKQEQKQKEIFTQPTSVYTAGNHSFDKEAVALQPTNKLWLNRLMEDLYVEECYQILSDYIQNK